VKDLLHALQGVSDRKLSSEELLNIVRMNTTAPCLVEYIEVSPAPILYRHQLGFYKFVLAEVPGLFSRRIRLHFWENGNFEDDVHDHISSFASKVLIGELRNHLYENDLSGDEFFENIFCAKEHGCHQRAGNVSRVRLASRERISVRSGESYYLNSRKLHRLEVVTDRLATVVVQDTPEQKPIAVFRRETNNSVLSESPAPLPAQEAQRVWLALADLIREAA